MGSSQMWWSASPPSPWGRGAGKWWALGGPLAVKAVGFLLLASLLFRVLCYFPSSSAPALQISKDEEFEVLSEEDLALLSKRFGRMYEHRKGSRRVASTCYRCGKMGHFIAECPENADKNDHKHRPKDEYKHRSRDKYKKIEYHSRHKNKEERRPKKHGGYKKKSKPRAMVADASDVDTSTSYTSSSSSSEDEDHGSRKEKRHMNRNFNGLACMATSKNLCTMAHSSSSKKSKHDDSDSDSDSEDEAEEPVEVYHDKEFKNRRWHFQSYNFTVSIVWAPFLIKSDVFENENGESTSEIQLHLDILDASWTSQYESFDYVIISGGQWFLKTAVYWENGAVVGCHYCQNKNLVELGFEHLYRKTLQKVFSFITSAKHKPVIFFRTWSPDHFENGEWFNGGSCNRVTPFNKGEYRDGYNERAMRAIELEEFNNAAAASRGSIDAERLKLMDTYSLSLLRPDGHVGPYRTPYPFARNSKNAASVQNDCLHWCVPGPIDAWNDLVMQMALDR